MLWKTRPRKPLSPSRRFLAWTVGALLIALLLALLQARYVPNRTEMVFDGVIVKKESPGHDFSHGTYVEYVLVIRDGSGKLVRFSVPRELYESARVGMPAKKNAGEPWATIGHRQEGATR
jgi:hypothetical protein